MSLYPHIYKSIDPKALSMNRASNTADWPACYHNNIARSLKRRFGAPSVMATIPLPITQSGFL